MKHQEIADHINENCIQSSCLMCLEADKYASYNDCPYLKLKQIARERLVTIQDVKKSMEESEV